MSEREETPRIRRATIPADAMLVVRGIPSGEAETSIRQAQLFRRRFPGWGRFGLSGFYARSNDEVLDLGEDRLERFATLFVYSIGDIIAADFEVVPTYRSPHVTIAFYDDPMTAVQRLLNVRHQSITNPAHTEGTP